MERPADYVEIAPGFWGRVIRAIFDWTYEEYRGQLRSGEHMYFVHYRGIDEVIPKLVQTEADFTWNLERYTDGMSVSYDVVATQPLAVTPLSFIVILVEGDDPSAGGEPLV